MNQTMASAIERNLTGAVRIRYLDGQEVRCAMTTPVEWRGVVIDISKVEIGSWCEIIGQDGRRIGCMVVA